MNIDGMTQLEIEKEFCNKALKEALQTEIEIFYQHITEEHIDIVAQAMGILSIEPRVEDMIFYILTVLGNKEIGRPIGLTNNNKEVSIESPYCVIETGERDIDVYNMIQAFAKSDVLSYCLSPLQKYDIAMKLIAQLDGIFFDLVKRTMIIHDGQKTTVTNVRTSIAFDEDSSLRAQYTRFRLPLIEKPHDWTQTQKGGYHLNKRKVTTNRGAKKQSEQALEALNYLQSMPWNLIEDIDFLDEKAKLIQHFLPKSGNEIEAENKATMICLTTQETYEALNNKEFYFEWRFDHRGRMYSTGYDINVQGNKFKKGSIKPVIEAQYLTDSGLEELMIDICNCYANGIDKLTLNEMISWVRINNSSLEQFIQDAESQGEFKKAVNALRTHQRGEPVSHITYVDASNQALQMYSALTKDFATGINCNLTSGNKRKDAYGELAKSMNTILFTTVFTRNNCKKALMTTLYGKRGASSIILKEMNTNQESLANDIVNEQNKHILMSPEWIQEAFQISMLNLAPKAMQTMDVLQTLNSKDIDTYFWTLPDGFNVKYDVKREILFEGQEVSRQGISFKFSTLTKVFGAWEWSAGMAPNIIHSIDGYVARCVILAMKKYGHFISTNHDAFGTHPNQIAYMRAEYLSTMADITESNLLQDLVIQIADGRWSPEIEYTNDLKREDIMSSAYGLM